MNLLLVNPVHPSTPHISGVRAWRFACELAGMGHRVMLLTAIAPGSDRAPPPAPDLHDWREPLIVAPAEFGGLASASRFGALRKIRTLWQMLRHGGYHAAWANAAVTAGKQLAPVFPPHVVWTTVGKMESAFVARRLSRSLGIPWVLDLKDNWELYVPPPLRAVMAWRVSGWSAVTANAGSTARDARRWHHADPRIVYSGVDDAFFRPAATPAAGQDEGFVVNLIGSLYFPDRLEELLRGIDHWSRRLPEADRERVEVRYIGGDAAMFQQAVQAVSLGVRAHAGGYVAIEEMASAARAAAVNMYVTHQGSFHHKLLELLASGRPVLAYPGESDESRALAAQVGGELIEPGDCEGVARALDTLHRDWCSDRRRPAHSADRTPALRYSWNAQTRLLEEVLLHAARQ
ncbi:MAG: glycosyltransferase [Lysobacter sp.]|nr:glycosyltransferase [Lysobacter sp.]